jgi:ADP-heptose:LPS heptosyltransferase
MRLVEELEGHGYRCVVVFFDEAKLGACEALRNRSWKGTIDKLGSIIGCAHAVIAVDSFVGHYAASIGIPVFTLFGPQKVDLWRPWGRLNATIQARKALGLIFHSRRIIEREGPGLMDALSVPEVATAVRNWLAEIEFLQAVTEDEKHLGMDTYVV